MKSPGPRRLLAAGGFLLAAGVLWSMTPLPADGSGGKVIFEKRCTGCHGLDTDKAGPRLRGVFGRKAASVASFQYSEALRKSGITWDAGSLDRWLADPDAFVKDTDMAFRVVSEQERSAIIRYLKELPAQ
ncbi:MAG TPA: c-type cytochrome [Verrucomicrobiae bacterium]|nr:c-type cytochrome [Verrucomicrobiae bacterium]